MNISDLVQPRHLARNAIIYVRQSTLSQVINNRESQRMQYALHERAVTLGWDEASIQTIDADLGRSGTTTDGRAGFQMLVADIALKKVGILIAYDATRLARNCSHWYQLLDLCARFDCLIGDRDGVYDPMSINGRLLLGLKGQISELELHTIRSRCLAGILNKAKRGEFAISLPAGLERLESGVVMKHPSVEIQQRIELVFQTLIEKRTIFQTVKWFRTNNLFIPRKERSGDIQWKSVTAAAITAIVTNPAYAGAAVYGRTTIKINEKTGKTQRSRVPLEQWRYCVKDKYPPYISWETFEKIQAMKQDNYSEYQKRKSRGVPRQGHALLHGLLYCGECGLKIGVHYRADAQYRCEVLNQLHGTGFCQCIPVAPIDQEVVKCFFDVLSAAQIDVANQALLTHDRDRENVLKAKRQQLDRLRYHAQLAERQFMKSDPDNRLVTDELERRWESALRELKNEEDALNREEELSTIYAIPSELLDMMKDIGRHLPELWSMNELLTPPQKKSLLRSLIEKIVIHRNQADCVQMRIVWKGGATTTQMVRVSVGKTKDLPRFKEMEELICKMARDGTPDMQIADELTRRGFHSARSERVLGATVFKVRLKHRILREPNVAERCQKAGFVTVPILANMLGVDRSWILERIYDGTIHATKDAERHCYLFPDTPETIATFQACISAFQSKTSKTGRASR